MQSGFENINGREQGLLLTQYRIMGRSIFVQWSSISLSFDYVKNDHAYDCIKLWKTNKQTKKKKKTKKKKTKKKKNKKKKQKKNPQTIHVTWGINM